MWPTCPTLTLDLKYWISCLYFILLYLPLAMFLLANLKKHSRCVNSRCHFHLSKTLCLWFPFTDSVIVSPPKHKWQMSDCFWRGSTNHQHLFLCHLENPVYFYNGAMVHLYRLSCRNTSLLLLPCIYEKATLSETTFFNKTWVSTPWVDHIPLV